MEAYGFYLDKYLNVVIEDFEEVVKMCFTKENRTGKEIILYRIVIVIMFFAVAFIIGLFMFALPYIICEIQIIIIKLLPFKNSISVEDYIADMLTIFNCGIMASLAYFAYCLSKRQEDVNKEMREVKKMLWATRISGLINNNRAIIIRGMEVADFNNLKVEDSALEDMISLHKCGVFAEDEYKLLQGFVDKVQKIKVEYQKGNVEKVDGLKKDFMDKYVSESNETDYKDELKTIVNKLDGICKGGKEC